MLGLFAPLCTQNKSALRAPWSLFLDLEVPAATRHRPQLPAWRFAVHLLSRSVRNMSFKLQDGCLLNALTLCTFASSYWWPTSLRSIWHKGSFCSQGSVSFPYVLLLVLCSLFSHLFTYEKKEAPLRASFSVQHLFIPFTAQFLYSHNISLSPHFQSTAQPPCPSLACPAADLAFVG